MLRACPPVCACARACVQVMGDSAWLLVGHNCGILRFVRVSLAGLPLSKLQQAPAAGGGSPKTAGSRRAGTR